MKRTRDYQLVEEIVWNTEYFVNNPAHKEFSTLRQSYATYSKACEAAEVGKKNPAIKHKSCTIIHKPTNTVLDIIVVK